MLKKTASVVLASFGPSPYPEGILRAFTRYGLAGRPFEHLLAMFLSYP